MTPHRTMGSRLSMRRHTRTDSDRVPMYVSSAAQPRAGAELRVVAAHRMVASFEPRARGPVSTGLAPVRSYALRYTPRINRHVARLLCTVVALPVATTGVGQAQSTKVRPALDREAQGHVDRGGTIANRRPSFGEIAGLATGPRTSVAARALAPILTIASFVRTVGAIRAAIGK